MTRDFEWLWNGFEVIAEAPNGVARLREMILSLAVQGRLVSQDANDEPASELLKRIAQEKARLVEQKKIRKSESLPPVSEDEAPFELPESWAWVRLGEVSDLRLGKMLDQHKNKGDLHPYLRNTNVQWQRFDLDDVKQMRFELGEKEEFEARYGDLLVCEGGEPGRCAIWENDEPIMFQKALHRVRPFGGLDSRYVLFNLLLSAKTGVLELYFTGATIKHFTGQALNRYVFPLPPLAEQKRIVAKVDELMAPCDELDARQKQKRAGRSLALRATLDRLERAADADEFALRLANLADHFEELLDAPESVVPLRAAILSLAVRGKLEPQDEDDEPASVLLERIAHEKARLVEQKKIRKSEPLPPVDLDSVPFEIPANWEWVRLATICSSVTDGDHQPPPQSQEGFPFLVISNVRWGQIELENTRRVPKEYIDSLDRIKIPERDDLLYTLVGSLGIPVEVKTDDVFCMQRHIAIIKQSRCLSPHFLFYSLKSQLAFEQANQCATGIAQKTVSLQGLRRFMIPLPPLAEQKRVVARVEKLMALCDELDARLKARQSDGTAFVEAAVRAVT